MSAITIAADLGVFGQERLLGIIAGTAEDPAKDLIQAFLWSQHPRGNNWWSAQHKGLVEGDALSMTAVRSLARLVLESIQIEQNRLLQRED